MRLSWVVLAAACSLAACGDDSSGGSGNCGKFNACGGKVEGNWSIASVCFQNPQALFSQSINEPACADLVDDFRPRASGSYAYNADGTYTGEIALTFDIDLRLTPSCINALAGATVSVDASLCQMLQSEYMAQSSTFTNATCTFDSGGCVCTLEGAQNSTSDSGTYKVSGNNLVDSDGSTDQFCVNGNSLTIAHSANGLNGSFTLTKK